MTPRVRIIVVNYNSGPYLARCIAALSDQSFGDFELVVLDNASTDASLSALPSDERLTVRRLECNLGFARANNLAAEGTAAPFLAFLNPDAIPEPEWLERLLDAAATRPDVQLFGSLQLQDDDPTRLDGAGDVYFFAGTAWRHGRGRGREYATGRQPAFAACAAAALTRRDWFERLGGFDEDYFCYFEDVDLAFRLRLAGGDVLQVNDAVVRHAGSAASEFVLYYTTRNQIWTLIKCMPAPLLWVAVPGQVVLVGLRWLRAATKGQGSTVGRALRDAVKVWPALRARRRFIQAKRTITARELAKVMTWSPFGFRRLETDSSGRRPW